MVLKLVAMVLEGVDMKILKYFGGDAGGGRLDLVGEGSGGRALPSGGEGIGNFPLF